MTPSPERIAERAASTSIYGHIIKVFVGPDNVLFNVYRDLLISSAPFFNNAFTGDWQEAKKDEVELEEHCPAAFAIFVHWMMHGYIDISFGHGPSPIEACPCAIEPPFEADLHWDSILGTPARAPSTYGISGDILTFKQRLFTRQRIDQALKKAKARPNPDLDLGAEGRVSEAVLPKLIEAFALGDFLQCDAFKNKILNTINTVTDQLAYLPSAGQVMHAYSITPDGSPLRRLFVDLLHSTVEDSYFEDEYDDVDLWPP